jgi:tRNA dimethylallyltransferase
LGTLVLTNKELVVIAGPTGVGKTKLGIRVAKELGTEIISADSRQIYKELAIGTAVPSVRELETVKHHFIQTVGITEYFNASIYEKEVLNLLELLFASKDKVVLLGGTGLYIDAVRKGIDELPEVDLKLRKDLQQRIEKEGLESLRKELKRLDPLSYDSIDLKNPKRVQKALEVTLITGKPYSSFLQKERRKRDFREKLIALNMDREILYQRINKRVDQMMASGWLDEVKSLREYQQCNALNTVGYKELFAYLDGLMTLDEAIEKIKANTRKYARKQITWFRKDPGYHWFQPGETKLILDYIRNEENPQTF